MANFPRYYQYPNSYKLDFRLHRYELDYIKHVSMLKRLFINRACYSISYSNKSMFIIRCPLNITIVNGATAAAGTELAGAYSSGTVIYSSLRKGVYNPRTFFLHAALLRQAFAHCGKFLTAASRRSLGRVSVPVWLIILSDQLLIVALVSSYLTN